MPEQQCRLACHAIDEIREQRHYIVVAGQAAGRRAAHPRQVWIDPPVPGVWNDRFDSRLDFAVVDTSAVQSDERNTAEVFGVVDHDFVDPAFHADTVVIETDTAGRTRVTLAPARSLTPQSPDHPPRTR